MQALYPIRAVSKITGLSPDTLRAWERRYRAVVPERSDRGREYGTAQVERLLLLGRLIRRGHTIGRIAGLPETDLRSLLDREASDVPEPDGQILAPVVAAVEAYDAAHASDELNRLAARLSPRELVYQVVLPLMRETGERWHAGTFAVAQEHLVSHVLRNILGGMLRQLRPPGPVPKIVLATPSGEAHDFGVLAAAMLASLAGLDPVYLGADLPAAEIAEAALRTGSSIVSLGITLPPHHVHREIRALAEILPENIELWLGGVGIQHVNLSDLPRPFFRVDDLPAFETQCLLRRNAAVTS